MRNNDSRQTQNLKGKPTFSNTMPYYAIYLKHYAILHGIEPWILYTEVQYNIRISGQEKLIPLRNFYSVWKAKVRCIELRLLQQERVAKTSFSSPESVLKRHGGEVIWVRLLRTDNFEGSTILGQRIVPIRSFIWLCGCVVCKHPFPKRPKMQDPEWERLESFGK